MKYKRYKLLQEMEYEQYKRYKQHKRLENIQKLKSLISTIYNFGSSVKNSSALSLVKNTTKKTYQLTYQKLLEVLMNDITLEQSHSISNLFQQVFIQRNDDNLSNIQRLCGLMILQHIKKSNKSPPAKVITPLNQPEKIISKDMLKKALYYMKFSSAAYGYLVLNSIFYQDHDLNEWFNSNTNDANIYGILKHTKIDNKLDICLYQFESTNYNPGHYLTLDHEHQSFFIITIRGTYDIKDILTDLIAYSVPFKNGYAHQGILTCAKLKFEMFKTFLIEVYNYILIIRLYVLDIH